MELISGIYDFSSVLVDDFNSKEKESKNESIKSYIKERLKNSSENKFPKDFEQGLDWMNTSKCLSFSKELRGKVVILDFFTYCCINCMHILPQLKSLEQEFKIEDGLVIIGVHSPKFASEHLTANVKAAVERYGISHPVVNDHDQHLWNCWGICCWPTLVVVGPGGELLLYLMGESHRQLLHEFVKEALSLFKSQNLISPHSIPEIGVCNEYREAKDTLLYPGKVCVVRNGAHQLLAVADTGHHRVLVLDCDGCVQHVIGSSTSGFKDGSFQEAEFNAPQGLVFADLSTLYVADTENHAIRKVDLEGGTVKTIVGNGAQGEDRLGGKEGRNQQISSPWDLVLLSADCLVIAMAGSHQLWVYYIKDTIFWKNKECKAGVCEAIVGSGREENRNNAYPLKAGLAQPSGLTVAASRQTVFVADSESSTVRAVSTLDGKVTNVVGGTADPQNLFVFGDVDSCGQEARLQHPLGVVWCDHKQLLYVADSYNHKVKQVDPSTRLCTSLKGTNLTFNEPGGLCVIENLLYIADTNNHCIKVVNLDDSSVRIIFVKFKKKGQMEKVLNPVSETDVTLYSRGGTLELNVCVATAAVVKPLPESPPVWTLTLPDGWKETSSEDLPKGRGVGRSWLLAVPPSLPTAKSQLTVRCQLFYCHNDTCSAKQLSFLITVTYSESRPAQTTHNVDYHLTL